MEFTAEQIHDHWRGEIRILTAVNEQPLNLYRSASHHTRRDQLDEDMLLIGLGNGIVMKQLPQITNFEQKSNATFDIVIGLFDEQDKLCNKAAMDVATNE